MPIPDFDDDGFLPPGIHLATIDEVSSRLAVGSAQRKGLGRLLNQIFTAERNYESIKRLVIWGSFVTDKPDPNDLDYSLVVSVDHKRTNIQKSDRRFLVPIDARTYYGVDREYLLMVDYPGERYGAAVEFRTTRRGGAPMGIVEIHLSGPFEERA